MILAIDQGTTGTTCIVVDGELRAVGRGYRELRQHFPRPGWVEQDPEEIWQSVQDAAADALTAAGATAGELEAVGVTNQRETTVLWERRSGRPVHRAIVWQDRRTAERCRELPAALIRERTGLVPDPYFSATKLEWLLAHVDTPSGELAFGTVDAWLVWKLTAGRIHATDATNASRTMLLDLKRLEWDDELLGLFGVDRELLPDVVGSAERIGEGELLGATVPIAGIAGDQQAALFGQRCFAPGEAKATFGTGTFVLVHVGPEPGAVPDGLLATAAAAPPGSPPQYALEGAVLASGAAVQWLRDGLGILAGADEAEQLARSVSSSGGVVFVPALAGLGSPHWRPDARGLVAGISRGTSRAHLARATLESIALQVADVMAAFGGRLDVLRADGGASANSFLMQLLADLLGRPVEVAAELQATALGAAALAGLAVGTWTLDELRALPRAVVRYVPAGDPAELAVLRANWELALRRTLLT